MRLQFRHPSSRKHSAQRILCATTLVLEAFVVLFAVLVAHQLTPLDRAVNWALGLGLSALLVLCSGLLRRSRHAYLLGLVLQVPVVLAGMRLFPMWFVGAAFAALFVFVLFKGAQLDAEKDEADARWYREHGTEPVG